MITYVIKATTTTGGRWYSGKNGFFANTQKEAKRFLSYREAVDAYVAAGLLSSRIFRLKTKPRCLTCGKILS